MTEPGGPYTTVELSTADVIAVTAAYDQLFAMAAGLQEDKADLRALLLGLPPGRAAVAALVTLGAMIAYLQRPNIPDTDLVRQIVFSALEATHYQELGR
jgi:hypothetical protein